MMKTTKMQTWQRNRIVSKRDDYMSEKTLNEVLAESSEFEGEDFEVATLLIDSDIVGFRAAAACDGRYYTIKDHIGRWKYKKDVVAACKEKGLSPGDIQSDYEPEPIGHALAAVISQVRNIELTMAAHYDYVQSEYYLTSSEQNFRLDINPMYKANRKGVHRPFHLKACKDYLQGEYGAKYCGKLEADDMIAVRAGELRAEGKPYVVCSIDKDFKQIVGWHYNWVNDEYWYVDEASALEFLWKQVVVGDATDNIQVPEGIGPGKAEKLFKDVDWNTIQEDELYQMVTDLYCEYLLKCGKKKEDKGIQAVKDFTDVRCMVEQTMSQVYLGEPR